jgi:hypothetical protein
MARVYYIGDWTVQLGPVYAETSFSAALFLPGLFWSLFVSFSWTWIGQGPCPHYFNRKLPIRTSIYFSSNTILLSVSPIVDEFTS